MSPKVSEAYIETRRNEILEAAFKCFSEKGFHNTTMQDIYKTANLSPGAVYNYFSSKEDIVIAATKGFDEWTMSTLESLISEKPNESFTAGAGFSKVWRRRPLAASNTYAAPVLRAPVLS